MDVDMESGEIREVTPIFVRAAYNYDTKVASDACVVECTKDEDMAQQSHQEECDINTIVARFGLTGEIPVNYRPPLMEDFEEVFDFQAAMNAVRKAEEQFMQLPWNVRRRFNDDPARLIAFLDDPVNRKEAIELGILEKPPEVAREAVAEPVKA